MAGGYSLFVDCKNLNLHEDMLPVKGQNVTPVYSQMSTVYPIEGKWMIKS